MEVKKKVLIISIDTVGKHVSGAGLRYKTIAELLSVQFDVTLAVPNVDFPRVEGYEIIAFDPIKLKDIRKIVDRFDTVITSGIYALRLKRIKTSSAKIVIDLYDPIILENLFYHTD